MSDRFFIDSNVLVYANDRSSPAKRARARQIIAEAFAHRLGCLSMQVLQEFFVNVTRKAGVRWDNARAQVIRLMELDAVIVDRDLILGAVDLHHIHRISFWDALIVKSAAVIHCRRLLTEDLNHGQILDGVLVENPFLGLDEDERSG